MESGWRAAHNKSVIEAARDMGIELVYENAMQSQEKQIDIIRRMIARKVDVIVFPPKTATGWDDVLREAKAAGIPVILSDRKVDVSDDTLWTAYIGSDFREEGRRAGRWLAGEAEPGRSYRFVELQGTADSAPATGRKIGFEEGIAGDGRFEIVKSAVGDFTKSGGKELMQQALAELGGRIDVVYCHNDDMALGAAEAIEAYGLKPGKDILLISVDATKSALQALNVGKLNFVVECNPLLGPPIMKRSRTWPRTNNCRWRSSRRKARSRRRKRRRAFRCGITNGNLHLLSLYIPCFMHMEVLTMKIIETERLILRHQTIEDAAFILELLTFLDPVHRR